MTPETQTSRAHIDLATLAGGRKFCEYIRFTVAQEFAAAGSVELMAFVVATESPAGMALLPGWNAGIVGIRACPCHTSLDPEKFAGHVRELAEQSKAIALVLQYEAWTSHDMRRSEAESDPARGECALVTFEHIRGPSAPDVWTADIRRPGVLAKPELAPFVRRERVQRPRCFSNLLPRQAFS